jgi:AraC-like DNA-binding protein
MSGRLAIVRAAHLLDYIAVMREIGMPVDRDLARSWLPPRIEETPNLYVSVPMGLEWVARCGSDLEPMHLGFLAARHASLGSLSGPHVERIMRAPTGLARLRAFLRMTLQEDSVLKVGMAFEGPDLRLTCDMEGLADHPFICLGEWLNLQAVISIVRSFAGATWCPPELTFVSRRPVPDAVQAAFPCTRILVGRLHTSIVVEGALLHAPTRALSSRPCAMTAVDEPSAQDATEEEGWTFESLLRSAITPYFNGGHPNLSLAADLAGMSRRTLQRKLQQSGHSLSELMEEARFTFARDLLDDGSARIIDVAMMSGYESPQHFSRAFRRFTGVTPSGYRHRNRTERPLSVQ